jgi:Trypsin-like peptidase domain
MRFIFFLLLGALFMPQQSISQMKWESVVQIREGNSNKTRGIGVVALKSDQILTALHVVAGLNNIQVYSKARGRMVSASIIAVHRKSDLALLQLNEPLNLPYVEISDETPDARRDYFIAGYDKIPNVKESKMDLATNFHKLTAIIEPTSTQYQWLINNGFPLPDAQIIRLDDPIQHGDSGSPILNGQGQLVGIADGGLLKGTQRMNWGISAKAHINELLNSGEDRNVGPSRLPFLKSARSENVAFDTGSADLDLYHIFSDYLSNIYETAFKNDQMAMNAYRKDALELSGKDFFNLEVDVYEDYKTGATITIPKGLDFEYNSDRGLLTAWTKNGNVEMNILVKEANSFNNALDRIDNFQNDLFFGGQWYYRENGNLVTDESNEELYLKSLNCTRYNADGQEVSSLIAEITIDGRYVLATSVTVYNTGAAYDNPMDWYYTYAMEACLVLSGFAIN